MMYVRGNRRDFDQWRDLGCTGWGYEEVLPLFRKSEDNRAIRDDYHGVGGPLTVSGYTVPNPIAHRFLDAAQEAGMALNPDFNGETQAGYGFYQATIRDGERCSTAEAFLKPVRSRANLTVATHAFATRILLEGSRAVGVEYLQQGRVQVAKASAEVVLCGGAFNSPHLLMVSGIGPAVQLEKVGVRPQHDLPGVGKNLQDHLGVAIGCELSEPVTLSALPPEAVQAAMGQYRKDRSGPFASNQIETGGFSAVFDKAWPELQLFFAPGLPRPYPEAGPASRHGMGVVSYINRPHSRGQVALSFGDPLDRPVIDPNYLGAPEDMALAIEAARQALKIADSRAFDAVRLGSVHTVKQADSDEVLAAYVREKATTFWHVCGTCKMGNDESAVVDPSLRVRGIDGLRVADAAVMPRVVSANTNAAVIMIGEKAAEMILC